MPSTSQSAKNALARAEETVAESPGPGLDVAPASKRLEDRIISRIQRRLGPRIRELQVTTHGNTILLQGKCTTYYSKQLAQHAALGVIEDESLDNAIEVSIAR